MRFISFLNVQASYSQRLPHAEEHYRDLWAEPIPPIEKRAKIDPWQRPVFSELHRAVNNNPAAPDDLKKERSVKDGFIKAGAFRQKIEHFRVTCQKYLCEYALMYSPNLTGKQIDQAIESLSKSSEPLCLPKSCYNAAMIGDNISKLDMQF